MKQVSEQKKSHDLTPTDIQFAIDSPEYVRPDLIVPLTGVIESPSSIEDIVVNYQRDVGPFGFLNDEEINELKAAGHLIKKINDGDFPKTPWRTSGALSDYGITTYLTNKVLADPENDFNIRPTDPEGDVNRYVFYERIGVDPDQVLAPILSSGSDVVIIQSGDELIYDKTAKRLKPTTNEGYADGWIVRGSELTNHLAMVGAVADCPMVELVFSDPDKDGDDAVVAKGMMHMGWPNIGAGIDLEMAALIKKEGLDKYEIHASVSPGARHGFELPKEVIARKSQGRKLIANQSKDDIIALGMTRDKGYLVDIDTVKLSAMLMVKSLGLKPENVFVSDRCTVSDPESHSHRREKGMRADRPQAGRFGVLSVPRYASHDQYFRDELFGNEARNQKGVLRQISEDENQRSFVIY